MNIDEENNFSFVDFDNVPEKVINYLPKIINLEQTKKICEIKWNEISIDKFHLSQLNFHESWNEIFGQLFKDEHYDVLLKFLIKHKDYYFEPKLNLLFNAFILTPLESVKVVFIGMRPFMKSNGLAFSADTSLSESNLSSRIIFNNQLEHNEINVVPEHVNLEHYAKQGCLMLNSELTSVKISETYGGVMCDTRSYWKWFIDGIIKYISDTKTGIIFVMWGLHTLEFLPQIDMTKHYTIISSSPSGLTYKRKMKNYDAFSEINHFGQINELLELEGKTKINW